MPKYYEISEAAAKRAKDMNSYSDYAPGSATAAISARRCCPLILCWKGR